VCMQDSKAFRTRELLIGCLVHMQFTATEGPVCFQWRDLAE
jgi:hypothetical protein